MSTRDPPWMTPLAKALLKKKKRRLNPAAQMDVQLILKKESMRSLQKIVNRLQVAWWKKDNELSKRKEKSNQRFDGDSVRQSLIIIFQAYVTMTIIPEPYA